MSSCYYFCNNYTKNSNINHFQSKSLCKNKLISISSQEEAKFIDAILSSNFYRKGQKKQLKNLNKLLKKYKIPMGK